MKVYVLTAEPYHDNSDVIGVYPTLDAAKAEAGDGLQWDPGPCWRPSEGDPPAWHSDNGPSLWLVQEFEVDAP